MSIVTGNGYSKTNCCSTTSIHSFSNYSGEITNFMIYKRVLRDDEIFAIFSNCTHPLDVAIRPQIGNVRSYRSAEIMENSTYCPTKGKITSNHTYNILMYVCLHACLSICLSVCFPSIMTP